MRRRECIAGIGAVVSLGSPLGYGQSPSRPESTCRRSRISAVDLNPLAGGGGSTLSELSPVPVGAPYKAVGTTESITKLLDGNRLVRTYSVRYFRDGQGRTREEREMGPPLQRRNGPPPFTSVTINDPISAKSYHLDPQHKYFAPLPALRINIVQGPVPAPLHVIQLGSMGGAQGPPPFDESVPLGERIIEGMKAVGSRFELTIEAGDIGNERPIAVTSEQWFSPELGVVLFATQQSPVGSEITYRLEHIERAEPDAELFVVPRDYTPYPNTQPVAVNSFSTSARSP
jgi:hypothetical protein